MRVGTFCVAALLLASCSADSGTDTPTLSGMQHQDGFVDLHWNEQTGRLYFGIEAFDQQMIYQAGLARGVGSNDIGLDRGQLGATRIVHFERVGPRVLLVEDNTSYRAISDNRDEQQAVRESFAQSVIWGFDVAEEKDGAVLVDATDFAFHDAHFVAQRFSEMEEGEFSVDSSRSVIYMPRSKAFPDNTEVEAVITFSGKPTGQILSTVAPEPSLVTVHVHHSFVRLPDDNYEPLPFDARSGAIGLGYGFDGYLDYASTIGEPLQINYGRRHRLKKKDPTADTSEAIEPIVYYVDRGAPEPVQSALIEGARWWNEAFEAAGYDNAFQVELMPEGADPMDVRYNVIQWVHRSTRGWSYGYGVIDPRTGEILKGHVSLGSLRVRQDYLIAEGLLAPYTNESVPDAMLEMSLARIRQLSAHEVGHTLGIAHNFAASTQNRASVMDYPFPLIRFADDGSLDLSDAYAVGMGAWDTRTILYLYQDFEDDVDDHDARQKILAETVAKYKYVADSDARGVGTSHPDGNLWDNGEDALAELEHLLAVRQYALDNFSERNIRIGTPLAKIEEALVPIYLLHRFQIRAVAKLLGGNYFSYAIRGDGQTPSAIVPAVRQRAALNALVDMLDAESLQLPQGLAEMIPPRPPGFSKTRESFPRQTGINFDAAGPADSAVSLILAALLNEQRGMRLVAQHAADASMPGLADVIDAVMQASWYAAPDDGTAGPIARRRNSLVLHNLLRLSVSSTAGSEVRAHAAEALDSLDDWLSARVGRESNRARRAQYVEARLQIEYAREDPAYVETLPSVTVPPGSPIGGD